MRGADFGILSRPSVYDPQERRRQRIDKTINTQDDLLRQITIANEDASKVSRIHLAATIRLDQTIVLSFTDKTKGIVVDGGGQFGFTADGVATLFQVEIPVRFINLSIETTGTSTTLFDVRATDVRFQGVSAAPVSIAAPIGCFATLSSAAVADRLGIQDCTIEAQKIVGGSGSGAAFCSVVNSALDDSTGAGQPAIEVSGADWLVMGNLFTGFSKAVETTADAGLARVVANGMNNALVNTTAGAGLSVVGMNTELAPGSTFNATDLHAGLNT